MHAILTTMGTAGDVLPFVALGAALRDAGHRVTVVSPEPFEPLVVRERLAFEPLISSEEQAELIGHPDFWHPLKGPNFAARWGVRFLKQHYGLLSNLARDDDSVLVTNPAILAARIIHEKSGRPLATMLLQPWMIRSNTRPPIMPAALSLPRRAPRPAKQLYWRAVNAVGDWLMGRELNELRVSLGLPPIKRVFDWWMSPRLMLGMFPAWFGDPQPDWPPQVRLTGFPMYDGAASDALPPELEMFLETGDPPIVVTFGTGMMHAPAMFRDALDACRLLGRRAVLVTNYPDQLPAPLPSAALHVRFASFRRLFARCSAAIHHGGIGTVAEAMAAGTPQLILPISWDQFDNATRVNQLGAGSWLAPRQRTPGRIAAALATLLGPRPAPPRPTNRGGPATDDPMRAAASYVEAIAIQSATASPSPERPGNAKSASSAHARENIVRMRNTARDSWPL
jgi:UDP:flavonoid glycosyltransferase YjiC (YdhE family)